MNPGERGKRIDDMHGPGKCRFERTAKMSARRLVQSMHQVSAAVKSVRHAVHGRHGIPTTNKRPFLAQIHSRCSIHTSGGKQVCG